MSDRDSQPAKKDISFSYGGEYDEVSNIPRRVAKSGESLDVSEIQKVDDVDPRAFRAQKTAINRVREENIFFQQVMKCSYLDYKYDDSFLKPGLEFYKWLCKKSDTNTEDPKATGLHMNIPDTLVYGQLDEPVWIFTGKNGFVQRIDGFPETSVIKKFRSMVSKDGDYTAVVKKPDPKWEGKVNISTLVTLNELRSMMNPLLYPNKNQMTAQLYIKPKGPKAFIIRLEWDRARSPSAWNISNKKNITDASEGDAMNFCLDLSLPNSASIVRMHGRSVETLSQLTTKFVHYMEKTIRPIVKFQNIVVDYIKDDYDRWWLIQVKAFKLDSNTISLYRSMSATPPEEASTSILDILTPGISRSESASKSRPGVASKPYIRLSQCRACRARFPNHELQHTISTHMLLETVEHLKSRGKMLPWFNFIESDIVHEGVIETYDILKICISCYNLYVLEQKLMHIEKQFSTAINIPQLSSADPKDEQSRVYQQYEVPAGLKGYRLMVFLRSLDGCPNLEKLFGVASFSLVYKLMGKSIKVPLARSHGSQIEVSNLRIFHFFVPEPGGIKEYFRRAKPFDLHLTSSQLSTPCLSVPVPLQHFATSNFSHIDLTPILMARGDSPYFCAHISIAYAPCKFVNPQMSGPLKFVSGAYIPSAEFYTCDPLPDEWVMSILSFKMEQKSEPSTSRSSMSEKRREFDRSGTPRTAVVDKLQEVCLWVIKIQLRRIENINLSTTQPGWSVQFSMFESHYRFEVTYEQYGIGNFQEEPIRLYFRASGAAMQQLLMEQDPLNFLLVRGNALISKCFVKYNNLFHVKCVDGKYVMHSPYATNEERLNYDPKSSDSAQLSVSMFLSTLAIEESWRNEGNSQSFDMDVCPLPPDMELDKVLDYQVQLLRFRTSMEEN